MGGIVLSALETRIDRIVAAIRELNQGRCDSTGIVTLRTGQTTTTVTAVNCGKDSKIQLSAQTANAAAALATTYILASSVVRGSFTITHANNAQADRTFGWDAKG